MSGIIIRLAALIALALATPLSMAQVGGALPIVIENPTPYARNSEPVSSGFAVPSRFNVTDPDVYKIVDVNGQVIPSQYKVLARWGGTRDDVTKPCKWVLIMFEADVPAAGTATYAVTSGTRAAGNITSSNNSNQIIVDTGDAQFAVSKTVLGGLRALSIDGLTVNTPVGNMRILDEAAAGTASVVTSTVIEEAGDVRTVVLQKGNAPQLGLFFTIRYHFWTDRRDVRVELRLENPGAHGLFSNGGNEATIHFERVAWQVKTSQPITAVASSTGTRPIGADAYHLNQDWATPSDPLNQISGFNFSETVGTNQVGSGGRHHGALGVTDGTTSISISVDRFWQNFPKAFRADGSALEFEPFPAFGHGPVYSGQYGTPTNPGTVDPLSLTRYRFEGGRWKTHSLIVEYDLGSTVGPLQLNALSAKTNSPLMARPVNLDWSFSEMAIGEPMSARRNWQTPDRQRFERMMDVLVKDSAADYQPSLGTIGFPEFRNRGGTYGGNQFFGWENFGDIVWGDGYASLHYDMPFGVLANWLRTGDYEFFDIGRDLVAHRRDYDQDHSSDSTDNYRGGQFYEKGWFHGNFVEPTLSHTWLHGLLLHYVLTGDEGSREAALQAGEFIMRNHPETWGGMWGARILGWGLDGLVSLHNYIGDPMYMQQAQATVANWIQHEQNQGGGGYVLNHGYAMPHAQTWMQMIVFNALAKYYYATGDVTVRPVMGRMADWYLAECFDAMPQPPWTASPVVRVFGRVAPGYKADPSVHHGWVASAALANAAACLLREDCLIASLSCWTSLARYHQVPAASTGLFDYHDPNGFSAIAYRMMGFPNSESKIHSNIALWGQTGMWLASLLVP